MEEVYLNTHKGVREQRMPFHENPTAKCHCYSDELTTIFYTLYSSGIASSPVCGRHCLFFFNQEIYLQKKSLPLQAHFAVGLSLSLFYILVVEFIFIIPPLYIITSRYSYNI